MYRITQTFRLITSFLPQQWFPWTLAAVLSFLLFPTLLAEDAPPPSVTSPPETEAPPAVLAERIDRIIERGQARTAFWGIYIEDLTTGEVLYQHNADKTLMPASTHKLFTTATAIDALGPDFRYETTLYLDGAVEGGILRGDLILEGSGDPTFGSQEVIGEDPLRAWAQALADSGITRIEGRIIGDDDVFDDMTYPDGWDVAHIATANFATATSGLSYRDNLSRMMMRAGRIGTPIEVTTDPPGYLKVRNRSTTHGRRRGRNLRIDRSIGTEQVTLLGSANRSYRGGLSIPVNNPTAYTLHSFRVHLQNAGIEVLATLHDIDDLREPMPYTTATPLFVHTSPQLSDILTQINKESDNFYAEQVFRTFSWGGAIRGGERRVKALLSRAGSNARGLSIRDGSGLSRKNMVTPKSMGRLLAYMYDHRDGEAFRNTLARSGERRTTLEGRLKGVSVRAKTGSLQYVRALSGYVETANGHPLVFVLFANNYTGSSTTIRRAIDEIVISLARNPS